MIFLFNRRHATKRSPAIARHRLQLLMTLAATLTIGAAMGLSLGFTGCQTSAPEASADTRLKLTPCHLSGDGLLEQVRAKCGTLEVFENREGATGAKIALNIAVIEATGSKVSKDPVFMLAGGPGTAATEVFPSLVQIMARVNQKRDIVLVDQRGTGKSHPLKCPQLEGELPDDEPTDAYVARLKACAQALDGDPRYYTTFNSIEDLEDVRKALGYDKINLYGGSYGTRMAFVYLRQHPDVLRSVIIDGVAPPDWPIGLTMARDAQRSFELLLERCGKDPGCSKAFPNLKAELNSLASDLEQNPVTLTVADPVTGEDKTFKFTRAALVSTVRTLSYFGETQSFLPLLIHQAYERHDLSRLAAQALNSGNLIKLNTPMHMSVVCAEDAPLMTPEKAEELAKDTYVGEASVEPYLKLCPTWPTLPPPRGWSDPVKSDVPVLLISGELDPVTPPSNAEAAARTLTHSRTLVVPGEGHGVIMRGCVPKLAAEFFDKGTADGMDASCLDTHRPLPFFLTLRGPQP